MYIKSLLSLTLFLCFIQVHAQSSITWQLDIGGTNQETSPFILPTDDGGFIVGGSTESGQTGIFSDPQLTSSIFSIFLFKYDANHVLEWQKSFGGDAFSEIGNILRTQDNGWLITGWSAASAGSGNKTSPLYGLSDFWVIKLDSQFQLKWQNSYGGSGGDQLKDAVELWDGSILLGGRSESPISGTKTENSRGYLDYWLVKIDSLGNQLWDKTLGSAGFEDLSSIVIASNGNITLSGITSLGMISGEKTEPDYGDNDLWVVSLDSLGNILWDRTLGGSSDDFIGTSYTDGLNYYIGGSSDSTSLIAPTMRTAPSKGGTNDCWLVKLDNDGNVLWDKCYGGDLAEGIGQIVYLNATELLLACGSYSNVSGDKTEPCRGLSIEDYWILKIDTSGNVLWDKTLGGSQYDGACKIFIKDANTMYIIGESESGYSGDKTSNNYGGYGDIWLLEFKPNTLGIAENASEQFSIYPNPVQNQFTVQSENASQIKQIDIINMSGQVMGHYYPDTKNETTISMDEFPTGMYWVNIIGDDFVSNQKIVKM